MRGLYNTDDEGIVQFLTMFPGYYNGRATHVHLLGTYGGTILANKTYSGGTVSSIGQLFFDQTLLDEVKKVSPYSTTKASVTQNSADNIFKEVTANGFDPVVNYVYLGFTIEDGIFSWVTVGVDLTATKSVSAAATLTANGGVASTSTSPGESGPNKSSSTPPVSLSTITKLAIAGLTLLAPVFF